VELARPLYGEDIAVMKIPVHTPPWPHEFVANGAGVCMFCQQTDLPVLARGPDLEALGESDKSTDPRVVDLKVGDSNAGDSRIGDPKIVESVRPVAKVGVCESCAVHVTWTWRTNSGEAQPVFDDKSIKQVSRVKVVLATRQRTDLGGVKLDPALVSSYDFAMVPHEGAIDLPGDDLADGEPEVKAVERALEKLKAFTWPAFIEPLYKAYTPRGKLVSVVFVSAWGMSSGELDRSHWRAWPPEQWVVPGMKGFYAGFENSWALRLFKYRSATQPTDEISVYVREGAVRYIRLQQQLRSGKRPDDLSMIEYLRQSMSDDERRVEAKLRELAKSAMAMKDERSEGVSNMGDAGNQGLVRTQLDKPSPEDSQPSSETTEGLRSDDDGETEDDEVAEGLRPEGLRPEGLRPEGLRPEGLRPEGLRPDSGITDPNEAGESASGVAGSGDDEDANEWPADLPFRPGEKITDGVYAEIPTGSPESGFVRVGRDLTTDPSKKSG